MSDLKRIGSLEVSQDLEFQQREWKFERAGWVAMAVLILLALLGLFGSGPLSQGTEQAPGGGLEVGYERFARQMSPLELQIRLPVVAAEEGQITVFIDRQYLKSFQIEDISPSPERVVEAGDWMIYSFHVTEPGQPGEISFHLTAQRSGVLAGRAGLDGGEEVEFSQFIFP